MGIGKYSPTVSASYAMDQSWWKRNGGGFGNGNNPDSDNDNDGFDSYGYSGNDGRGPDRLGNTEDEYGTACDADPETGDLYFYLYENAESESRGKLLGDLNEFVNINSIIKNHNLDNKKCQLHQNLLLSSDIFKDKDNKFISNDLIKRGYIHNSKVESFLNLYHTKIDPKIKNNTLSIN